MCRNKRRDNKKGQTQARDKALKRQHPLAVPPRRHARLGAARRPRDRHRRRSADLAAARRRPLLAARGVAARPVVTAAAAAHHSGAAARLAAVAVVGWRSAAAGGDAAPAAGRPLAALRRPNGGAPMAAASAASANSSAGYSPPLDTLGPEQSVPTWQMPSAPVEDHERGASGTTNTSRWQTPRAPNDHINTVIVPRGSEKGLGNSAPPGTLKARVSPAAPSNVVFTTRVQLPVYWDRP